MEIVFSSNTQKKLLDKVELFIEASAKEVWLVAEDGSVSFYNQHSQLDKSTYKVGMKGLV